ncbi:hypothetical protein E2C01_064536 [Portunus trituberculatus]|uniref:Uncharacterized protein n=1 Tax=Portunus trituberculatus TaxID=210409 RepID=A0A5B7HC36_PORTR|nr:hypothetical protein [Portunus trituberculatus]
MWTGVEVWNSREQGHPCSSLSASPSSITTGSTRCGSTFSMTLA